MASTALRREERIGLVVAVALHAAVLAALLVRPPHQAVVTPPQRIEVTISDLFGPTSTSPDPFSEAAPDRGPVLGEPAPQPALEPEPVPEPSPEPRAAERPAPRDAPKPAAKPVPKPTQGSAPAAPKSTSSRRSSAIDDIVSKPNRTRSSAATSRGSTPPKKAGSSAFSQAFESGLPGGTSASGHGMPASQMGPQVRSALSAAITRQLKPHWSPPAGVDAEQLVTILSFDLNPDGSLDGKPQVVRQLGITAANSAQASRHAEQAIRAVQLASPFNLPSEYYDAWKRVSSFRFDVRLSQ
jgi:outer membrane biosynthesis protein TonB